MKRAVIISERGGRFSQQEAVSFALWIRSILFHKNAWTGPWEILEDLPSFPYQLLFSAGGSRSLSGSLSRAGSRQQRCDKMVMLHETEPNDMNNAKHDQTGSTASDPTTPLLYAAENGHSEIVQQFLALAHQQNQIKLDSLDRTGQRSIEPQRPQKGAVLYSSVQLSATSGHLCHRLWRSVRPCTELPKMET